MMFSFLLGVRGQSGNVLYKDNVRNIYSASAGQENPSGARVV